MERGVDAGRYRPDEGRTGIGLCLSGGGFRAALFHLGALRRLNELGLLQRLRTISSVSGGSIVAAHLATLIARGERLGPDDWETVVVRPFRRFTASDIRTGPILRRLLPWNWWREGAAVRALAARCRRDLTPLMLDGLPARPDFVISAADMAFGDNWVFERTRMGAYQPGYLRPPPRDWPLGLAVAASTAFPPFFGPLPVRFPPDRYTGGKAPAGPARRRAIADLELTDGGIYDNLGLEPVWKDHAVVLVSDGGALFSWGSDSPLWHSTRYTAIAENQGLALRKRWLIASYLSGLMQGAYWGIGGARSSYDRHDTLGYSKEIARRYIARIRTDLDAFSDAEAEILQNHGYLLADAALRRHVPGLLPAQAPPAAAPYPAWLDPGRVVQALANSDKIRLFGRG